jgi:uncharacterized protein (DUF2252 family)
MNIHEATRSYEAWLSRQTTLVSADVRLKHQRLKQDPFQFLRGTYYRWAQVWPSVCADEAGMPAVLSVGDLHVENFGTWRDMEGRLIWGINDFDEAVRLPYANDLIRLAVSARLAADLRGLNFGLADICDDLLSGYAQGLATGGRPFVLAESFTWLRDLASRLQRDPVRFWRKLQALPDAKRSLPPTARRTLEAILPEPRLAYRVAHRVAGLGSLGRARWLALADWRGGLIAREIKPALISSYWWSHARARAPGQFYQKILGQAVRVPDPVQAVTGRWFARRLAPDCIKIELDDADKLEELPRFLEAAGQETANIHLGDHNIPAVRRDLERRPAGWLRDAAANMLAVTRADWKDWHKA